MSNFQGPATIRLDPADNVVVSLGPIPPGAEIEGLVARAAVPMGHKLALREISPDQPIIKLGQVIGFARGHIRPGEWVHSHNVYVREYDRGAPTRPRRPAPPAGTQERIAHFSGYRRPNGSVGTRNYIAVMSSVNCSATAVREIVRTVERSGMLGAFPNVDGVIGLTHGGGCSLKPDGPGYEILKRTQFGYLSNPNVGGAVMVGLGCEGFQIERWKESCGLREGDLFRSLTLQGIGGTRKAVTAGIDAIRAMLPAVDALRRSTVPAAELVLALQCGGSDGYSGITANPALGAAVDILVRQGGTAILSETPEIFGAEHLLTAGSEAPDCARRIGDIMAWWKDYTAARGMELDNNPSPGNKAGGLTTILEKSLGAVAKGGTTPVRGVYSYAEKVTTNGLVFMDTPGYDPVSATGQVAGGANVMCFTTGRGSAFGCKPTPSLKLASNTRIYEHMIDDMDIDCGDVLRGVALEEKGQEIFDRILSTASGARTKSEELGYGDAEFIPWEIDAVM